MYAREEKISDINSKRWQRLRCKIHKPRLCIEMFRIIKNVFVKLYFLSTASKNLVHGHTVTSTMFFTLIYLIYNHFLIRTKKSLQRKATTVSKN